MKKCATVDFENGFILATTIIPASVHDTNYLPFLAIASWHTKECIKKIYADKGYYGEPNRVFLNLNDIEDGIMREGTTATKLAENEKEKQGDIEEQIHSGAVLRVKPFVCRPYRAKFTKIKRNIWDAMCRQMAFNLSKGSRLLVIA